MDYLGIVEELKEAVAQYTTSGGKGSPAYDKEVAVALTMEKYEVVKGIFHGFDWTLKDSVKAKIRSMVKRILRKYNYPPDKQEQATRTVLEQAELLCGDWAERDGE